MLNLQKNTVVEVDPDEGMSAIRQAGTIKAKYYQNCRIFFAVNVDVYEPEVQTLHSKGLCHELCMLLFPQL